MNSRVIKAAILGAGTVGSGVYKIWKDMENDFESKTGACLEIKKVLVRDIDKKRDGIDSSVLTDNWRDIIDDKEIEIVIELMGGTKAAKDYVLEAL